MKGAKNTALELELLSVVKDKEAILIEMSAQIRKLQEALTAAAAENKSLKLQLDNVSAKPSHEQTESLATFATAVSALSETSVEVS